MLRIIQNQAPASAKSYYSQADYLGEGQERPGTWGGEGAAKQGLSGQVGKKEFDRLCDNLHPITGRQLTPRMRADRTVGYDFNFHCPKGVSLAYLMLRDERILEAFETSVDETMQEAEADARVRVRRGGRYEDRVTGNLCHGDYTHFTSRPVGGIPDGHLHRHCFVFNVTWDEQEQQFKACQFRDIKRDAPYLEASFHARLAKRLADLGYTIERKGRQWDIAEIPQSVRDKFSRRTAQIEEIAAEEGITNAIEKDGLAARSREKKTTDYSMTELRAIWWERLTDDEKAAMAAAAKERKERQERRINVTDVNEALKLAELHCFERQSVVPEKMLLTETLRRGLGHVTVESVHTAHANSDAIVRNYRGRRMATTPEVLAEERAMLDFARERKASCEPLNADWTIQRDWLNREQRAAITHVLQSRSQVMIVKGGAGTGKTSLMTEAVAAIEAGGHQVFTFAPSAEASRGVLQQEGFQGATTVAELLVNEQLQQAARHQVLWIDEAGLLGSRTLRQVFDLADELDARVILSGDWGQHGSVERGAALRLLEQQAGLKPAYVTEIQRQKGEYRDAVASIAAGNLLQGFDTLNGLGWIKEHGEEDRYQLIAKDYADSLKAGKTTLIVSPTRAEGQQISKAVREELKTRRRIRGHERNVLQLTPLHLTEAERRDRAYFQPGDVIVFQKNCEGHRKGERIRVSDTVDDTLLKLAPAFSVYRSGELPLARGDLLKITANGTTMDGKHRLNNGAVYQVAGFDRRGNIRLTNGWMVAKDYGFVSHGYVSTSHSAQGKTVDHVILAESSMSFPAGSMEQFYVSASRGRQKCTVYTDDTQALLDAVGESTQRLTATELTQHRTDRCRRARHAALIHSAGEQQPIASGASYGR